MSNLINYTNSFSLSCLYKKTELWMAILNRHFNKRINTPSNREKGFKNGKKNKLFQRNDAQNYDNVVDRQMTVHLILVSFN